MAEARRYPLAWPLGWKRTRSGSRDKATFGQTITTTRSHVVDGTSETYTKKQTQRVSIAAATDRLERQLELLGATHAVLSSNVELRLDGRPRTGQRDPDDPGAAVYFRLHDKPRCLAGDKWDRVADNIAALANHIDAIRRIDRYGIGDMERAFAGYAALPASPFDWWIVLEVTPEATTAQVDDAFRRLAKASHPDSGGTHEQMARLNAARDEARKVGR